MLQPIFFSNLYLMFKKQILDCAPPTFTPVTNKVIKCMNDKALEM